MWSPMTIMKSHMLPAAELPQALLFFKLQRQSFCLMNSHLLKRLPSNTLRASYVLQRPTCFTIKEAHAYCNYKQMYTSAPLLRHVKFDKTTSFLGQTSFKSISQPALPAMRSWQERQGAVGGKGHQIIRPLSQTILAPTNTLHS